ncbi:MAG: hypothetical protein HOQ24_14855 [Mycobacteriaceae bacterium]|nr:hypothetical protein [Mycobacteriaceae bacterium]
MRYASNFDNLTTCDRDPGPLTELDARRLLEIHARHGAECRPMLAALAYISDSEL